MAAIRNSKILEALAKAVTTDTIASLVPQDLEAEAHNTLWEESDPGELTILKLMPSIPAKQINHEFAQITSFGFSRNSGFFGERSLPPESNLSSTDVTVQIKLMGEIGPTYLLAALEETVKALGTTGGQNIERVALRLNLLRKKARNIYFSDDTTLRQGSAGVRFKGLAQLIREGTDGTVGTSPFGSHEIDMEGEPLTVDTIRARAAKGSVVFGMFRSLVMDPQTRSDFEGTLDAATRLQFPIPMQAFMVGQMMGGLQTQGQKIFFETDNTLSPAYSRPQYSATLIDGAPTTLPTVVAVAQADDSTTDTVASKWDAASAGNIYYVVTETVDELEGYGTRFPAGVGVLAVAAGQEVELTLTPGNALADSMKVYRGNEDDGLLATDAWFIFEVSNSGGGGPVTAFDNNLYRPNTSWAFGLNIDSNSSRAMQSGMVGSYDSARDKSAAFLVGNDRPRNTVALAQLGPAMGIMSLAAVLATVDRPLMYSACAPLCRNPFQNITFKNIGRR